MEKEEWTQEDLGPDKRASYNEEKHEIIYQNKTSVPQITFKPPRWVPDSEVKCCTNCQIFFTIVLRKHHCRACGRIFCATCADKFILLPPQFNYKEPVRVCFECYKNYCGFNMDACYDVNGPDNAPALILLNGALGIRSMYKYQIEALSPYYRVITTDTPGHGGRYKETLTKETAVDMIKDLIEKEVPAKKAIIAGHSMGGYMALLFAKKYPDMCQALIVSGCMNETYGLAWSLLGPFAETVYTLTPKSQYWKFVPLTAPEIPATYFEETMFKSGLCYDQWLACHAVMMEPRQGYWKEAITSYDGPILFMSAEKDMRYAEKEFIAVAKNAKFNLINGATHVGMILDPKYNIVYHEHIINFGKELGLLAS